MYGTPRLLLSDSRRVGRWAQWLWCEVAVVGAEGRCELRRVREWAGVGPFKRSRSGAERSAQSAGGTASIWEQWVRAVCTRLSATALVISSPPVYTDSRSSRSSSRSLPLLLSNSAATACCGRSCCGPQCRHFVLRRLVWAV